MATDAFNQWLRPEMGARGVEVISTTRAGGVSTGKFAGFNVGVHVGDSDEAVQANRKMLHHQIPSVSTITWLNQVHGTRVIHAPSEYEEGVEADAVWSDEPGFACAVMTGDCLPVVLADIEGRCVAAVHGGWRGLAGGILKRTVEAMPVDADRLFAWLGPAIGPSAFGSVVMCSPPFTSLTMIWRFIPYPSSTISIFSTSIFLWDDSSWR